MIWKYVYVFTLWTEEHKIFNEIFISGAAISEWAISEQESVLDTVRRHCTGGVMKKEKRIRKLHGGYTLAMPGDC